MRINYNNAPDTLQLKEKEVQNQFLKPYTMFRYSVRSEVTRKYYERRLRKSFDFIEFEVEVEDAERRYNDFAVLKRYSLKLRTSKPGYETAIIRDLF